MTLVGTLTPDRALVLSSLLTPAVAAFLLTLTAAQNGLLALRLVWFEPLALMPTGIYV